MLEYYDNNIYGIYSSPQVSTCTPDWQASLAEEIATVHNPVLPLAKDTGPQFKKDSFVGLVGDSSIIDFNA